MIVFRCCANKGVRSFADAVQGLAAKLFAGLVQRRMTSTPCYFPVATIVGDMLARGARVVYP